MLGDKVDGEHFLWAYFYYFRTKFNNKFEIKIPNVHNGFSFEKFDLCTLLLHPKKAYCAPKVTGSEGQ